ncbi:unnamed protein product [Callosobruchus maculatus]|uniref:Uncharacterized protein n=1 Tax=Callosobruchus maculatus TaxID=64391 RepID=A0A653DPS1_CALMS|nr:unnamed protein product [Callosobruchus maculatus]
MSGEKVRGKKRSRSSEKVDGAEIKIMLESVMQRLNVIEQRQKRRRRSPVHSSDYSASDNASHSDIVDSDDFSSYEDESRAPTDAHSNTGGTDNLVPETVNINSILGDAELPEKCFSEPILEELVPRYEKVLLSGLKEEARVDLIKKYLPPENMKAIVPPKLNPEVKVAIQENTLKRDNRLSTLQEQIAAVISALVQFTSDLAKKGGEDNLRYIETSNDALRLLCDVFHHESVSRRELLLLNLNKDLKETLQNTTISEWLFGTGLENTIEAAKKLEKSGEQLKVKKNRQPSSTLASTSKQENFRHPFAKGVQQMGRRFQRRTPLPNNAQPNNTHKRTKNHRAYSTHRHSSSVERRRLY